jgi:large repetitive protein
MGMKNLYKQNKSENSIAKHHMINYTKTKIMKQKNQLIKWCILLLLFISGTKAMAQGPYPNTGPHSVCQNAVEPYGVVLNAGSTYAWSVTPLAGGNGTITAGATPNLITITWTTVGTATLQVIETNSFGCVGDPVTIIVTINPIPTLVITNPAPVCAPNTVDLTLASVTAGSTPGLTLTYWTDAAATIPYPTPTAATAGTYYIKGTTAAGCFDIKPVVISVLPAPIVVINNPAPVCSPGTVDLTAGAITAGSTPGLTFTYWTDAAATIPYPTPTAATAGTYYIKGTLAGGCFDIKAVVVTINPSPTVVITNPAPVCAPNTVNLTLGSVTAGSTPGLTFTYWTDAAATIPYPTPTAATAGTYYIKGTNASGCFDIKPVVVTLNPLPTPAITGPSPVCQSTTAVTYSTANVAGHTYNWVVTGGTIATGQGTNTITVIWTTPGAGSVSVTETITAGGCTANNVKSVTINPKPVTTPITHN